MKSVFLIFLYIAHSVRNENADFAIAQIAVNTLHRYFSMMCLRKVMVNT